MCVKNQKKLRGLISLCVALPSSALSCASQKGFDHSLRLGIFVQMHLTGMFDFDSAILIQNFTYLPHFPNRVGL